MREYKFRGKNKDIGWVEGQLVYDENKNPYIVQNVEQDSSYGLEETMLYAVMWYRVIPETLSQYTGLKDKNGKEIYEGDIILIKDNTEKLIVKWYDGAFVLVNKYDEHFEGYVALYRYMPIEIEVIGNIYDNPELLRGE